ncbi:P-loop containing nucleoside triphosphate hydrolase protein [Lentithecium fluviatile CBS 122367]|uniref:P-loop containing nucleoside triphosphate hydrolase protein n=1 Tax=Lentithecium fluviatile CBS 122367 TaxID=1168545 RepID=A0A6G1JGH6_9PLEO|nr:P-loop containing nucleoside triphosphate hydrolase protein [Lentithecium fluviatile CBS 122367]
MAESPLLLGISGPSSSGKTTLSRLLRDIFPLHQLTILHLDDFYHTDADIPVKGGIQDWDCIESLNLPQLQSTLAYIKEHAESPPEFVSKEDQNSVGEHGVDGHVVQRLKEGVRALVEERRWRKKIVIVDGFLLFSEGMKDIREAFDVRLFLRTSYKTAKGRREARSGYVTLEGFWEDPPGYVDKIVWPNYVEDHKFLFEKGDVEGKLDEDVCRAIGLVGMPKEAEENMTKCLEWAVAVLEDVIGKSPGKAGSR